MKKIALQICLFFLAINLHGQAESPISKGKIIIGGSLSIDKINNKESFYYASGNIFYVYRTITISTNLELEYLLSNHWAIGLITEDQLSSRKDKGSTTKFNSNDILIGPVLRFYIKSGLFIMSSVELGRSNTEYSKGNLPKYKYNNWSYNVGLGYSIMLDRKIAIEPLIRYNYYHTKEIIPGDMITRSGDLGFVLGIHLFLNISNKSKET